MACMDRCIRGRSSTSHATVSPQSWACSRASGSRRWAATSSSRTAQSRRRARSSGPQCEASAASRASASRVGSSRVSARSSASSAKGRARTRLVRVGPAARQRRRQPGPGRRLRRWRRTPRAAGPAAGRGRGCTAGRGPGRAPRRRGCRGRRRPPRGRRPDRRRPSRPRRHPRPTPPRREPAGSTPRQSGRPSSETVGPQQPHLLGVPPLELLVPVAGAVDRQLADPPVGDEAVDQLAAVPLLPVGLPALLELEEEAAGRPVQGLDPDRAPEGVVVLAEAEHRVEALGLDPPVREREVAEDVLREQPLGPDPGLEPAHERGARSATSPSSRDAASTAVTRPLRSSPRCCGR